MARCLLALFVLAGCLAPASAIPPFQKQFIALYASGDNSEFNDLVKKQAKCLVCHQGKSKKNRNAFGDAVHEYLSKKDKKDTDKIVESLEKVVLESSDPADPEAPTYKELIEEGKLPGGELEDLKTEPGA